MIRKLALVLVLASAISTSINAQSVRPSLDLKLDGPKMVSVGGESLKIAGPFAKGPDGQSGLAIGGESNRLRIPAHSILAETGTIIMTFMTKPIKPASELLCRAFLTVRGESRQTLCFYQAGNQVLCFAFKNYTDSSGYRSVKPTEFNQWVQAACTWDGTTVKFFLNGIQQAEFTQPYTAKFPAGASFLHLGPYIDGATNPEPWHEDSCVIREVKVYKQALEPRQIMAAAGVKVVDIGKQYSSILTVPRVTTPPVIDGKLDDGAWQRAGAFISLIDGIKPEESFSYKDNNPRFCHDGKSLYVGFRTVFPGAYRLMKGDMRGAKDSEVWTDESFEFYLDVAGKLFRFGGNVAGGSCESRNSDDGWSGRWQYKTTLAVQIDNSMDWQGEICIPFETLGLTAPVGSEFKVNFCRTWRGLDRLGMTALAESGNYGERELYATLKMGGSDIGLLETSAGNPNFGTLEQKLQAFSGRDAAMEYTITLLSSSGAAGPRELVKKALAVKSGASLPLDVNAAIESTSFDRLLFQVKDTAAGQLLMQQVVPFKVVENYLDIVPAFSSAKVFMKPRYTLVKSKTSRKPLQLELLSPSNKALFTTTITSNNEFAVPFARVNDAGKYHAVVYALLEGKKKVFTDKAFNYDGIGPWENIIPEERVLPPFEPLTVKGQAGSFDIGMWGRVYRYGQSLLPTAITALQHPVLSAATLSVDGREATLPLTVTKAAPYRVELTGRGKTAGYDLTQSAWIEYDGLLWNTIDLTAKKALGTVTLTLDIPASIAKFFHATAAGFGAGGRRTEILDKDVAMPFWPMVWIGDQEQGLCWFAESADAWKTANANPIRIVKSNGRSALEITFADKLVKGQALRLQFGLLATPVKPLPKEYPFTMMGDPFQVQLNRQPPHEPTTAVCIIQTHNAGAGFFDLNFNGATKEDFLARAEADLDRCNKNNVIFAPYQIALFFPEEYQVVKDNLLEWQIMPENNVISVDYNRPYVYYNMCPASQAANYYLYRFKELLKTLKLKGVYFDFGTADRCSNRYHGCTGGYTILAKREFYKRIAGLLADANNGHYTICVHNSESAQIPTLTFATHFLNGEGLRQASSSTFHFGKDILDTYTIADFASEHSSLPWGVTSSIYIPADPLAPQYGGDKEGGNTPQEKYKFRMTKAAMAGALIHNTIPSDSRIHFGWYDKLIRFYEDFKVNQAEFMPYWRNSDYVRVVQGKDIYVSFYRHHDKKELLAVISHVSKEHLDQDVMVEFNPAKLGLTKLTAARELLTSPDPDYKHLYTDVPDIKGYADISRWRIPVELGDFGVEFKGLDGNCVKLALKHHSVALVKISAE